MSQSGPTATERRQKRVAAAFSNPVYFAETYIRPHAEDWVEALPPLAREILAFAMTTRRGVIMTPPEFLKTTLVSQVYPLWVTCRYAVAGKLSHLHGALLSELQELAERNLSVIAWHIENNDLIRADFVDVHGRPLIEPDPGQDKWTDEEIIVRRPTPSKDPTWQAKGVKTTIQGARLNHLIGDDMVTPGSAKSVAKQRDAQHRWDHEVRSRLVDGGQALIAGNFNWSKDLLSTIAARPRYKLLRRPALHMPGEPSEAPEDPRDPEAVEALPSKWPKRRLFEELAESPATFPTVYLLRDASKKGVLLRDEWVRKIALDDVPREERVILFSLDPAPGAEVDPDPSFFTITVAIMTPKHLDVVESFADRMEPTEQVATLAAMVDARRKEGHVGGIAISKVALDKYARGALEVGDPSLRPILHPHAIGTTDKTERLAHLGSYGRSGWLRIADVAWNARTASTDHAAQETTLAEEWLTLGVQRHDDRLDGVDLLVREAIERGYGPAADPGMEFGKRDEGEGIDAPITEGLLTETW